MPKMCLLWKITHGEFSEFVREKQITYNLGIHFIQILFVSQVDAEVYWKLLKIPGSSPPTTCEVEWNVNTLKNIQNKSTLMCIQLPTKVKNDKPRVFKSEKSAIQGLLNG